MASANDDAPSDKTKQAPSRKDAPPPKILQSKQQSCKGKNRIAAGSDMIIEIPQKISGGNVLSPNQMLLGFVVMVICLLKMSSDIGVMFVPKQDKVYQRLTKAPVNRSKERREYIRNALFGNIIDMMRQIEPNIFDMKPAETCDLYLNPSSLPESGWAFFAGKNYTLGESIRVEHGNTHLLPLLLKPHSVLSNVKWEDPSILVATRNIAEGEEFFVSWEDHLSQPQSGLLLQILSTPEDFSKADEHIQKARTQYFGAINYTRLEVDAAKPKAKRGKGYGNANARRNQARGRIQKGSIQPLYKKESVRDIESGLSLWKMTLETYDPLVAKLLPTKVGTLALYHRRAMADQSLFSSSSQLVSLRNQTIKALSKTATCASFLEWKAVSEKTDESKTETDLEESCSSTSSRYKQIVKREHGFSEGEVVGVIPLLVTQKSDSQDTSSCLPLSSLLSSQKVVVCPLREIKEHTQDPNIANVEYRWSNSTMEKVPSGVRALLTQSVLAPSLSSEEEEEQKDILLKKFPLSLAWDIVAIRDIEQNETVVVYQPNEHVPFIGGI